MPILAAPNHLMSDNAILFLFTTSCLVLILFSFRFGRLRAAIHLAVFAIYSSYGYYGLFELSRGTGNSLVWFFYLLLALAVQILVLLVYIITRLLRSVRR